MLMLVTWGWREWDSVTRPVVDTEESLGEPDEMQSDSSGIGNGEDDPDRASEPKGSNK